MSKKLLHLTNSALKQLQKISSQVNNKNFELSLKSGGCNGLQYNLIPTKTENTNYEKYTHNDISIYICDKSLMYLICTEIDWEENMMSKNFTFNNPNVKFKCGCGTSFTPKNMNY